MMRRSKGLSMVELLVALTIGSILIAGAVYVYSQSRKTHTISDAVARLQENGRFVLSVIEPDIQLAGYYGFTNVPDDFKYIQGGSTASPVPAAKMQKASSAVTGIDATQTCGNNFAVNLIATVEGTNSAVPFACTALGGGYRAGTDGLTVRHASAPPADGLGTKVDKRLQLLVSRLSPSNQFVFADGTLPAAPALKKDLVQVRDLVVRSYYVAKDSTSPDTAGLPALRVKTLADGPAFTDAADLEIMRGVEDFQVQFGIDTGDYNGDKAIDAGRDVDGNGIPDAPLGIATKYVNPDKLLPGFQVVAVRVWILLRAETPEQGFIDDKTYTYADKSVTPKDGYRRVLMSRTIQTRNARTF
jgi:type IV pilus assembly protein PilW